MDWLRENCFWIGVAMLFLWMHTKMHGAHGGHDEPGQRGPESGSGNDAEKSHAQGGTKPNYAGGSNAGH